ncbi:MAG: AEC family transporter, partial [Caldilineaceae bacterium]|nr:AEC family transporter [Caldilineaceae bacterium]
VTSSVGLALVVLAVLVLRRYGLVKPDDATVINNLLIYLVYPAHILHRVMYADLGWEQVRMIVTLLTLCFVDLALAYLIGRMLRRSRPEIGALMLTTGFAATAVIAAPVLFLLYPNDIERHADLIIVSEFGMSLPTLLLAPIIAQLFGETTEHVPIRKLAGGAVAEYVRTPIFFALALAITFSLFDIHVGVVLGDIMERALQAASDGGFFLPLVLVGLMLERTSLRGTWIVVAAAVVLQTVVDPMLTSTLARLFVLSDNEIDVMMILTMTPAAVASLSFARRYNCAPELAATIVFVSILSIFLMFPLMYAALA